MSIFGYILGIFLAAITIPILLGIGTAIVIVAYSFMFYAAKGLIDG